MLRNVTGEKDQRKRGRPRKRGERTPLGQQCQIAARISNGVHFQSPVLPGGIESQADWDAHLGSLEEALQPVGRWEKYCVYRVALSAWQFFRLTRHISSIIGKSVTQPDNGYRGLRCSRPDENAWAKDDALKAAQNIFGRWREAQPQSASPRTRPDTQANR